MKITIETTSRPRSTVKDCNVIIGNTSYGVITLREKEVLHASKIKKLSTIEQVETYIKENGLSWNCKFTDWGEWKK